MILIFHKNNKVSQVYDYSLKEELSFEGNSIQEVLVATVAKNKSKFIGWCHLSLKDSINVASWNVILTHKLVLVSFETSNKYYMPSSIGYVEETPFINVNKNVVYPTWLMSTDVGVMHASVLFKFKQLLKYKLPFDLFLNTIAKKGIKQGLLCYSNPLLLNKGYSKIVKKSASKPELLQFIKSNYRYRWVFLYMLNQFIYKKRILLFSFLFSLMKKKIQIDISLKNLTFQKKESANNPTIDVLIPTLGREKQLHNVLIDLSKQTLLPKKVIIVEQIPEEGENSKLDFIKEDWPFEIDHTLIYQLGACNARNIALQKVTADWVFFADDDVRFNSNLLEEAFKYIGRYEANAISMSCLQKNEIEAHNFIFQSTTFGSGTSIVNSKALKDIKFGMEYEFGYGEDVDFGMQLRNRGVDILYLPFVSMLHLKAPIGGFRKKIIQEWAHETIQPKPSPTVMVYHLKHATKEQFLGYKTILFLKFYKSQSIKNPFKYIKQMNKMWNMSVKWASKLINNEI